MSPSPDKKLKVLQVRGGDTVLGAERVVIELCKGLGNFDIDASLLVPVEGGTSALVAEARNNGLDPIVVNLSGAYDLSAREKVRRVVSTHDFDIVHSHGYREDLFAYWCRSKAKICATNHLWKRNSAKMRLYARLDSLILRRFDGLMAVSTEIADEMQRFGLTHTPIAVVPNGIDVSRFPRRDRGENGNSFNLEPDNFVFGTVSSLTVEKRVDRAIRAFAIVAESNRNCRLMIVGDGPERSSLEELADSLNVGDLVSFIGRFDDIPSVLAALNCFLLPSDKEGLPIALMEAMAAELPVVASLVGDVGRVVDSDVGFAITNRTPEAFSAAMLALVNEPTMAKRIGENGRRRIIETGTTEVMCREYAAKYHQLLSQEHDKY